MSPTRTGETEPRILFPEHPAHLCPSGPAAPMPRVLISMDPHCRYPMLALHAHPCVDGRCRCDEVFMRIEASRLVDVRTPDDDWCDLEAFVVLDLESRRVRLADRSRADQEAMAVATQLRDMLTETEWDWFAADRQRTRVLWALQRSALRPRRLKPRRVQH